MRDNNNQGPENLRLALVHVEQHCPERLLEFVSALALYWASAGQSSETQIWAERALANAPPEQTELRADALLVHSLTASRVHDTEKSVEAFRKRLHLPNEQAPLGRALVYLANAYIRAGSYEERAGVSRRDRTLRTSE